MTVVSRADDESLSRAWAPAIAASPKRWVASAILLGPGIVLDLLDWASRREQIAGWPRATLLAYAGTLVLSAALWAAFIAAASARRAWVTRALLVVAAALAIGAQRYFFDRYHAYMNPRAVLVGTSMLPSVGQQLWVDRASFVRALSPPVALAVFLPWLLGRAAPMPRIWSRAALDVTAFALVAATFSFGAPGRSEQACPTCSISRRWAAWRRAGGSTTKHSNGRIRARAPPCPYLRLRPEAATGACFSS